MNAAMSIAAAGLRTASAVFAADAAKVVQASNMTSAPSGDLATAMVGMTTEALAYRADLAVFKMADKTTGTLLDMMA